VACQHDGYRDIVTRYDRAVGQLTYYWRCEACRLILYELSRLPYRPHFAPLPQATYLPRPPIYTARCENLPVAPGRDPVRTVPR
jgi:hypothetical protein